MQRAASIISGQGSESLKSSGREGQDRSDKEAFTKSSDYIQQLKNATT